MGERVEWTEKKWKYLRDNTDKKMFSFPEY